MKTEQRIKRIEKQLRDSGGENWEQVLDRLGLEKFKQRIKGAKSFLDVVSDQSKSKVWQR